MTFFSLKKYNKIQCKILAVPQGRVLSVCVLVCLIFTNIGFTKAQDIHFSQVVETPLLRNPALAGLFAGDIRVQTIFRSQWNSFTDAYKTGAASLEYKLPVGQGDDFMTVGAQVLYDRAGTAVLTSTHVLPVFNFHKSLNEDRNMYLSLAGMGGLVQRSIDRSKITTNSQFNGGGYDPNLPDGETFNNNGYRYFDATVGLSFNTQIGANPSNNIYAGAAYHHLNKPKNISFYSVPGIELKPKWVFDAGLRTYINDDAYITLIADYARQDAYSSVTTGVLYTRQLGNSYEESNYAIHAGGYYRFKDAFIPVVKLEAKPVSVSVSYDVNVSELRQVSTGRGGFEISLTYQKYTRNARSSKEVLRCPRF